MSEGSIVCEICARLQGRDYRELWKMRRGDARRRKSVMVAVAACAMTLSAPNDDGGRSSWQRRLLLAQGTGGRGSRRSDGDRFRGLGRSAIIVGAMENNACNCKDSDSIKDEG